MINTQNNITSDARVWPLGGGAYMIKTVYTCSVCGEEYVVQGNEPEFIREQNDWLWKHQRCGAASPKSEEKPMVQSEAQVRVGPVQRVRVKLAGLGSVMEEDK